MPATNGLERREFLQRLAAAGAAVGWPALASASPASKLPAGTLMIGCGGAGCKVVRRVIGLGLSPAGFVAIDTDKHDLCASRAAHQVQCGLKYGDFSGPNMFLEEYAQVDALLQAASKVVLVGGLGTVTGGNWLWMITTGGGIAERHIAERGLDVEVVASMPRRDARDFEKVQGAYIYEQIRLNRAVKMRVDCNRWLPYTLPPCPILERELWLTRHALLCALDEPNPSPTM